MQIERIRREAGNRGRALVWLNLLCLDAPLVAVVWQAAFASTFNVTLPMGSQVALFLTAWLIYLGDRLADVLSIKAQDVMSARQAFCFRYRRYFLAAIIVVALADSWLILSALDGRLRFAGGIVGLIAAAYLIINHSLGNVCRLIPLKELSIGFLFASGTVIGVVTKMAAMTSIFCLAVILFGCLCTVNCVSIAVWEQTLDEAQGKHSIATRFGALRDILRQLAFALAAVAGVCSIIFRTSAPLINCIALSFVFLALLDVANDGISRDQRTALADLALLTPIGFLITQRL